MTDEPSAPFLKIKAQIMIGDRIAIGPGKAALLEAIAQAGSIAAAGRLLGLSYRRTRNMVDTLNQCWKEPLIVPTKGGRTGGGTTLSPTGVIVLAHYRMLESALKDSASLQQDALMALTR